MLKVCVVHLSFVFHFLFPLRHPHESCTAGSSCCYLLQLHIEQFAISCDSFHISQASFSMLFQKKKNPLLHVKYSRIYLFKESI